LPANLYSDKIYSGQTQIKVQAMNKSWLSQFVGQVAELARFPKIFQGFDTKSLLEILDYTAKRGTVSELFARVSNRLQREPHNLAALYLAGTLAGEFPEDKEIAFDYLKFGFEEGKKQGLPTNDLLLFYQGAAKINLKSAFSWLTQVGGNWDNREGWKFLLQEAAEKFGKDSQQYRILVLHWQLQYLNQINEECFAMESAVTTLIR
jgi:ATP-dependent DNA helicase RecQ